MSLHQKEMLKPVGVTREPCVEVVIEHSARPEPDDEGEGDEAGKEDGGVPDNETKAYRHRLLPIGSQDVSHAANGVNQSPGWIDIHL